MSIYKLNGKLKSKDFFSITKRGHVMFLQDVLKDLKRKEYLESRIKELNHHINLQDELLDEIDKSMKASEWISFDDRLPMKGGFYLFSVNGDVLISYYFLNWEKSGLNYKFLKATHWKPLPKPPEEKS